MFNLKQILSALALTITVGLVSWGLFRPPANHDIGKSNSVPRSNSIDTQGTPAPSISSLNQETEPYSGKIEASWSEQINLTLETGGPNATANATSLVMQWATEDWSAAARFVSNLAPGREQVIIAGGVLAAPSQPEMAAEWVEQFATLPGAHTLLFRALDSWHRESPNEGADWILSKFENDNTNVLKCLTQAFETWPQSRWQHLQFQAHERIAQ